MKKILTLTLFGFCSMGCLLAQSVSLSTIVPQGEVTEIDSLSLEWTIGETFVHTIHHDDGILTQGTQQPVLEIQFIDTSTSETVFDNIDVQVFPNPTAAVINIALTSTESTTLDIALFDVNGKQLTKTTANSQSDRIQMDITDYVNGIYLLILTDEETGTTNSFKVVKK